MRRRGRAGFELPLWEKWDHSALLTFKITFIILKSRRFESSQAAQAAVVHLTQVVSVL